MLLQSKYILIKKQNLIIAISKLFGVDAQIVGRVVASDFKKKLTISREYVTFES